MRRKDRVAWGMQCSTPASFIILFSEIIIPSLGLALGLAMLHLFLTHRGKIKLVVLIWLTAAHNVASSLNLFISLRISRPPPYKRASPSYNHAPQSALLWHITNPAPLAYNPTPLFCMPVILYKYWPGTGGNEYKTLRIEIIQFQTNNK